MEEFDYHPEKPTSNKKKKKPDLNRTIISIGIFIVAFLAFGFNDLSYVLMIVSVVFIHELGHFLMMKGFGFGNLQMTFVPFLGAFVNGKKDKEKQVQNWLIILAGPVPGVVLGISLFFVGSTYKYEWVEEWAYLFLFLNVLNLIPLDPLDGGQLLKSFMGDKFEITQIVFSFISSLIMILVGWYFEIWVIVIFGFFMGLRIRSLQRMLQIHKELKENNVNYILTYKELPNRSYYKIKEILIQNNPTLQKYLNQFDESDIESLIVSQVENVLVTPVEKNGTFLMKVFVILTWLLALLSPLILFLQF
ncbi:MAG: site-2 protease family protein [Crocinitomicaceae bacterium]